MFRFEGLFTDRLPLSGQPGLLRPISAALLAGIITGAAAWLLKWLIKNISKIVTSEFDITGGNWHLILVAIMGIMLVGWLVRHVVRMPLEHATRQLKKNIAQKHGNMPGRLVVAPVAASALTLGCGGSAGAEGPISYTGAAIASNIARITGIGKGQLLTYMACGAGAGIAAIFKAPVGGMFFTIEVLNMAMGVVPMLLLAIMCFTSALTAYLLSGCTHDLAIAGPGTSFDMHSFPAIILLGLVCGAYSAYYKMSGSYTCRMVESIKQPVVRNLVSGTLLGVLLFMFPALYGEGYGVLTSIAGGDMAAATNGSIAATIQHKWLVAYALGGILLTKAIATYATNSGGGVAGDFAPTLFAGGIAGAFACVVYNLWPVFSPVPAGILIICGMAGVMSGVIRAPIMTIFLVVEMSGATWLLLPVTAVTAVSLCVSKLICRT